MRNPVPPEETNDRRADRAANTILVYGQWAYDRPDEEEMEYKVSDLLTDLMHLIGLYYGDDFDDLLRRARADYEEERQCATTS